MMKSSLLSPASTIGMEPLEEVGYERSTFVRSPGDAAILCKDRAEILIVEDETDFLEILGGALKGYDIVTAEDGKSALSIYRQRAPDLVITDIVMPKLDGIQLINEISKYNTPIVAFSGYPMDETSFGWYTVQEATAKFFEKPFVMEHFVTYVDHVLRKSGC